MVLFKVVIRTLFFYFFITISYRLMGKREVGQLGVIDLIVSILIAELVAISIENHSEPIYLTIVPIVVLVGNLWSSKSLLEDTKNVLTKLFSIFIALKLINNPPRSLNI